MKVKIMGRSLELIQGDITDMDTDAIVNAANSQLVLGGGVAGAIRTKGGPSIQEECNKLAPIGVGEAVITGAGLLRAKHVIHAVGPRMGEGQEEEKLKSATLNSLRIADENGLESVSFPAISTGIFGFPIDRCAQVMLSATVDYLKGQTGLKRVVFCLFGQDSFRVFRDTLESIASSQGLTVEN